MAQREAAALARLVSESPDFGHDGPRDALERMVARLLTQRDCIGFAAARIADLPGPVLELGLGKGRTFDHLRRIFAGREIHVFDRDVHCPPHLVPEPRYLHLGEFPDTLPALAARDGRCAVLVHADIGSEDRAADRTVAVAIAPLMDLLVRPGGLVLADRDLSLPAPAWQRLPLPPVAASAGWPYFIWQAGST